MYSDVGDSRYADGWNAGMGLWRGCAGGGKSGDQGQSFRGCGAGEGGTWERACSSGMSRRRRMEKRISSGICSISESRGMGSETAMFAELGV